MKITTYLTPHASKSEMKLDHGTLWINTQNFSSILDSFGLNKFFFLFSSTQQAQCILEKNNVDKLDLMKITNSFPSEGTVKMNKPATSYEEIFANSYLMKD